jgi:hypothetical protein
MHVNVQNSPPCTRSATQWTALFPEPAFRGCGTAAQANSSPNEDNASKAALSRRLVTSYLASRHCACKQRLYVHYACPNEPPRMPLRSRIIIPVRWTAAGCSRGQTRPCNAVPRSLRSGLEMGTRLRLYPCPARCCALCDVVSEIGTCAPNLAVRTRSPSLAQPWFEKNKYHAPAPRFAGTLSCQCQCQWLRLPVGRSICLRGVTLYSCIQLPAHSPYDLFSVTVITAQLCRIIQQARL